MHLQAMAVHLVPTLPDGLKINIQRIGFGQFKKLLKLSINSVRHNSAGITSTAHNCTGSAAGAAQRCWLSAALWLITRLMSVCCCNCARACCHNAGRADKGVLLSTILTQCLVVCDCLVANAYQDAVFKQQCGAFISGSNTVGCLTECAVVK